MGPTNVTLKVKSVERECALPNEPTLDTFEVKKIDVISDFCLLIFTVKTAKAHAGSSYTNLRCGTKYYKVLLLLINKITQ